MKLHILVCLLFLFGTVLTQQQTTLTYLVQYEDEQQEDYIELGLTVSAEGSSLVKVMNEALKIAQEIKKIATEFCLAHTNKKGDCKDIVEIGNYDINPKYQVVKRQSKFMGFEVEHQVAIKVLAIDHISDLADTILKEPNTKIISFEWKPLEEVNKEEAAVKQGTEQGEELCEEIGMHMKSIQSVEEMTESATEETAVYKFKIACLPGKVKKAAKEVAKQVKADEKKQKKDSKPEEKKEKNLEEKKEKKLEEKKEKKPQEKKSQQKKSQEKKPQEKKQSAKTSEL